MQQREILLAVLKSYKEGTLTADVSIEEVDKTIEEIENFKASFGTMLFTTCKCENGYFYINLWGKEKFYCPSEEKTTDGWIMRKLK